MIQPCKNNGDNVDEDNEDDDGNNNNNNGQNDGVDSKLGHI